LALSRLLKKSLLYQKPCEKPNDFEGQFLKTGLFQTLLDPPLAQQTALATKRLFLDKAQIQATDLRWIDRHLSGGVNPEKLFLAKKRLCPLERGHTYEQGLDPVLGCRHEPYDRANAYLPRVRRGRRGWI
jgi:hypothetical protein